MNLPKNLLRVGLLIIAAGLAMASGPKPKTTYKTEKTAVFYKPRPKFEWRHRRGNTYRVVLSQLPRNSSERRRVLEDIANYTERTWKPQYELDFERAFELFVWDQNNTLVTSWRFTIAFQPPKVITPAPGSRVRNLSPEFRIEPFDYGSVWYGFELATDSNFDKVIDKDFIPHSGNIKEFAGPDKELGTDDDIRFVPWTTDRVLKPSKTYYWRIRGYYYLREELSSGAKPDKENALGRSEETGSFTIPSQSGSDSLANVTMITRDSGNAWVPVISSNMDLGYVLELPGDSGGSELRVAAAEMREGRPVFSTGREEFTKVVQGSYDYWPTWDIDGEGMFFASNRSQNSFNIWYKRRGSRGYTQLTFHTVDDCASYLNCGAYAPAVSKDGNKIAYQLTNPLNNSRFSIWTIDRDGRQPTELGEGMSPKYSQDGKKLVFVQVDNVGEEQVWIMDSAGGNRVQITNSYRNIQPVWHPNGRKIVFVSQRSGASSAKGKAATDQFNWDIWEVDLQGAQMRQLTTYLGGDVTPEFTPDGRFLLFSSTRGGEQKRLWMGEMGE